MKPSLPAAVSLPSKTLKQIKTGSNVRGRALATFHAKQNAEAHSALAVLRKQFHSRAKKLLSKRDLRKAVSVSERLRQERNKAAIKSGSDGAAWEAGKEKFRRATRRELARAVPAFRDVRALIKTARRDFGKLLPQVFHRTFQAHFPFDIGNLPELESTMQVFAPPFALFDVTQNNQYDDSQNDSFALPGIGHVVNKFHGSLDEDTSILNGIFGLDGLASVQNRAGCGFNFTVPSRGRLRIITELQHLFTRVNLSLEDNFGFSSGILIGSSNIYVNIIRGQHVIELRQTMVSKTLDSDGDDMSTMLPAPDINTPFTFDVTTEETFEAGTDIQIVAGCMFSSGTSLDDMKATVDAFLWHQIKRIAVDVVLV